MENELELTFENEVDIYLPQVIADEHKRKANERDRIANEEVRQANEEVRVSNELVRESNEADRQKAVEEAIAEMTKRIEELQIDEGLGVPIGGTTGQVLAKKSDTDHDTEWVEQTEPFSKDYNELINTPTIPSSTSELTNDSGFITSNDVPTKVSQLANDKGYITSSPLTISNIATSYHLVVNQVFNPGASASNNATYTKSGYYPICISWACNYDDDVSLDGIYIASASKGSCTIHYDIRNNSSSASTTAQLKAWITWAK